MIAPRPLLASAVAYTTLTILMGRRVIEAIGTSIAGDAGDPLLTTAILSWNATHLPWTDAWYQFPIFFPTSDALALSEHLLGISVFAAPIEWLTGNPVLAYNLIVLLSYPLCGLAMYALVWKLTWNAPAAFLAGLAYAFAPYRAGHVGHIQMLISFWMPIALLALHSYLESRRWQWLVVFAATWLLQGAANGYYLVYFTMVTGLWVAWFMAARGRWRDVGLVAAAMVVGALPLAPILLRYIAVQRGLGLSRNIGEITAFSADISAPLCAPVDLTFWGWLRVACAQEGELFAGAALIALCVIGVVWGRRAEIKSHDRQLPGSRVRILALRTVLALAALYGVVTLWTLVNGPWRIDVPWRASASSADKPASVTLLFLLVALLLSRWFHSVIRRGSTATFYLLCGSVCWLLALGPFPRLLGEPVLYQAPYAWLLQVPGVMALRVPARLWSVVVLCVIVFMGIVVARLLAAQTMRVARIITAIAACGLVADGWATIRAADVPAPLTAAVEGRTVLFLPIGDPASDRVAGYHAVNHRFRSINGYSGYEPQYYEALRTLSDTANELLFAPLVARGDLDVLVSREDQRLRALVEQSPSDRLVSEGPIAHYRLSSSPAVPARRPGGARIPLQRLDASCGSDRLALAIDGDLETSWNCGLQTSDESITADLGEALPVGTLVHALGSMGTAFPRRLVIETSLNGQAWTAAWEGSPAVAVLEAAMAAPLEIRAVFSFQRRTARFVRLRQIGRHALYYWSIAELEVWSD